MDQPGDSRFGNNRLRPCNINDNVPITLRDKNAYKSGKNGENVKDSL